MKAAICIVNSLLASTSVGTQKCVKMENQKLYCYIVFSSAFLIPFLSAKTFSLNEALATESRTKDAIDPTPSSFQKEKTGQRFSLNKALSQDPLNKLKKLKSGELSPVLGKSSSLKGKSSHHNIDSLRLGKLNRLLRPLQKRKKGSKKRETLLQNDKIDKKYFPILNNLGLLLDNLLNSEPIDSYEVTKNKFKRHKQQPEKRRGIICKCALESDAETGESRSYKKATLIPKTVPTEIPPTTTSAPDTPVGDLSSLGQDKDVSLLLPRDSVSDRRDNDGYSEGSSATFHRGLERNFSGNLRDRKHHPRNREGKPGTESYEENTYSHPRNRPSSDERRRGRHRGDTDDSYERNTSIQTAKYPKNKETNDIPGGDLYEYPRETKLKNRRNETKSEEFVPQYIRGLRRRVSEDENGYVTKSLQSQENHEKSFDDIAFYKPSDKRVPDRGSPTSTENQEVDAGNEALISLKDLADADLALQKSSKIKAPSVTIIDGYSVARDKNGPNKLSEKTIHIHT